MKKTFHHHASYEMVSPHRIGTSDVQVFVFHPSSLSCYYPRFLCLLPKKCDAKMVIFATLRNASWWHFLKKVAIAF